MSEQMQDLNLETVPLESVTPYENNPRKITRKAIDGVRESIEKYGYVQPIVVDLDRVIVVGHTRFQALKELGYTEIAVQVMDLPKEKADEYRLVDNRVGELSEWDNKALILELREFEQTLLDEHFPEIDLEVVAKPSSDVTEEEIERAKEEILRVAPENPQKTHMTKVECPSCYHVYDVRTRTLPGLTFEFLERLIADGESE